ncbi:recombinase family protein [Noviherbaspirillum saxi]|nr:recombinase family protein [Noviherbaspirillum saxi]
MLQQLLNDSAARSAPDRHWRQNEDRAGMKRRENDTPVASAGLLESINAQRARGESFASIAAALNKQGFSGGYGGRWYASSVWAYLQRRSS